MRSIEQLIARLRAAGGKLTPQRLFLFRALASSKAHPTAEQLYEHVRADVPTLSLATVYKTLNELVELGEVRTVEGCDGHTRYDPNTTPHAHLLCSRCGALADAPPAFGAVAVPSDVGDFQVTGYRLTFDGFCARCRERDA